VLVAFQLGIGFVLDLDLPVLALIGMAGHDSYLPFFLPFFFFIRSSFFLSRSSFLLKGKTFFLSAISHILSMNVSTFDLKQLSAIKRIVMDQQGIVAPFQPGTAETDHTTQVVQLAVVNRVSDDYHIIRILQLKRCPHRVDHLLSS
jgi:hypothetical protein